MSLFGDCVSVLGHFSTVYGHIGCIFLVSFVSVILCISFMTFKQEIEKLLHLFCFFIKSGLMDVSMLEDLVCEMRLVTKKNNFSFSFSFLK